MVRRTKGTSSPTKRRLAQAETDDGAEAKLAAAQDDLDGNGADDGKSVPPREEEVVVAAASTMTPRTAGKRRRGVPITIKRRPAKKKAESEAELTRLFEFLNDNPGVVIEVRGHTNNLMWPNVDFANELSTNRAKEVADWLIAKGIAANRIQSKGFGWTMPVEPNINAEGRKKNQRVEVKILSM